MDTETRYIEEACFKSKKSQFYSIYNSLERCIVKNSVHIFSSWFFSCYKSTEVDLISRYLYSFICITSIDDDLLGYFEIFHVIFHRFFMSDNTTTRTIAIYQEGKYLPVRAIPIRVFPISSFVYRGRSRISRYHIDSSAHRFDDSWIFCLPDTIGKSWLRSSG